MIIKKLFVLMLLTLSFALCGQESLEDIFTGVWDKIPALIPEPGLPAETGTEDAATETVEGEGEGESTGEGAGDAGEAEKEEISLFDKTLELDITTAGYYELLSWCRQLGLEDSGNKKKLAKTLLDYYNITPTVPAASSKKGDKKEINIESADRTEFYTIEEVDEKYIKLEGNVVLVVKEEGGDVIHEIHADRITVNLALNLLYAEGDILYKKTTTGEKEPELYKGETLSFNIKSSDGVFYNGTGESDKDILDDEGEPTGETMKYLFKGRKIIKKENDNIILEDAVITSSKSLENPNWHIKARRVMVLAPEEWAIENATPHIGEIPFFWFPLFFNPGDQLFFNPVLGYKDREGAYVQTTTYLVGEKTEDKKPSAFSFLNVTDDDDKKEYETEIKGLFLRKRKVKDETPRDNKDSAFRQGDYLKIMLDIYSRLGFFAGADMKFSNNFNFFGGVGVSRTVHNLQAGSTYTYLIPGEDPGFLGGLWNSGLGLPFRFGFNTGFKIKLSKVSLDGAFEALSDPAFPVDFYSRLESMDFFELINITGDEEETEPAAVAEKSSLVWKLDTAVTLPSKLADPYISNFRLSPLNFKFNWSIAEAAVEAGEVDIYRDFKPERRYYYPEKIQFPDSINVTLGGTLLSLPFKAKDSEEEPEKEWKPDPGKGFRTPFSIIPKAGTNTAGERIPPGADKTDLRIPVLKGNTTGITISEQKSTFDVTYNTKPSFFFYTYFKDDDDLTNSSDIDLQVKYLELKSINPVSLNYSLKLLGQLLNLSGALVFHNTMNDHPYRDEALDLSEELNTTWKADWDNDWDGFKKKDKDAYLSSLKTNLSFTLKPLLQVYNFQKSSVKYSINADIWEHKYNKADVDTGVTEETRMMEGTWFPKDEDEDEDEEADFWEFITSHTFSGSLVYTILANDIKLDLTSRLRPLDWKFTGSLIFPVWKVGNTFSTGVEENREADILWKWAPLQYKAELTGLEWLSLSQSFSFDLEDYDDDDPYGFESTTRLGLFQLWGKKLISASLFYDFENYDTSEADFLDGPESLTLSSNLQNLFLSYKWAINKPYHYDDSGSPRWILDDDEEEKFISDSLTIKYEYNLEPINFWKRRIELSSGFDTTWTYNFIRIVDSTFKINFNFNFKIHEFTDLQFSVSSYNDKSYIYFDDLLNVDGEVIESRKEVFTDLLNSFSFWDTEKREISDFNLEKLSINLIHKLDDWYFKVIYSGSYEEEQDGPFKVWKPRIELEIAWHAIPEMKRKVEYREGDEGVSQFYFPKE